MRCLLLLLSLLCSCQTPETNASVSWQEIKGRNPEILVSTYRAQVPLSWSRIDPDPTLSLADTRLPLCRFFIEEELGKVEITIHNFPSEAIERRIPPQAQVERWRQQLLPSSIVEVEPCAHGGFSGLQLRAETAIAWAMQLAPEHYRALQRLEDPLYAEMRADYTVKAIGPQDLLQKYSSQIEAFARSFELIKEIPLK